MRYSVIITPGAESDLRTIYRHIRKHAPLAATAGSFEEPIRELLYGKGNRGTYRILYAVLAGRVFVLHVRHGSRLPLQPDAD